MNFQQARRGRLDKGWEFYKKNQATLKILPESIVNVPIVTNLKCFLPSHFFVGINKPIGRTIVPFDGSIVF
ncbi:MAG: hypothetical protein Sapg2KO_09020 [Saprospiraceae bacterium]